MNSRIEGNDSNGVGYADGGGLWTNSTLSMIGTDVSQNTADNNGGGMRVDGAATIASSRIENNASTGAYGGGGLYLGSTLFMTDTLILSNTTSASGGGALVTLAATVTGSRVENNTSTNGNGGGLNANATLAMTDTHVISNSAKYSGGGVFATDAVTLVESYFVNNTSESSKGGGLYGNSTMDILGTQILSNTADRDGGGLFALDTVTVAGSRFENNQSISSNGGALNTNSTLDMTGTDVLSNSAPYKGGGVYAHGAATVASSRIEHNESTATGGGAGLYANATLAMTDTRVLGNTASQEGGGLRAMGATTIVDSRIQNNESANNAGGGLNAAGSLSVINSLIVSNTAVWGGGIFSSGSPFQLINSTLVANQGSSGGGAAYATGSLDMANSILWANTTTQVVATGATSVERSIIQDGALGGIQTDPSFVRNADRTTGDLGDLHLRQYSSAIDAGDDTLVPAGTTSDLDGLDRLFDVTVLANNGVNVVDLGAYEVNSQAVLPSADAGGPYATNEGSSISLDGSGSSGFGGLTGYAWDCRDDANFEITSTAPTGDSCLYLDSGSFTVHLMVTDSGGITGTGTSPVTVGNLAPIVTPAAVQSASEGTAKEFSLGSFTDAGVNDNPWQVAVDWGDGSAETNFSLNAQGSLPDQTHSYAKSGDYDVTVTVTDKDGDAGSAAFTASVADEAPLVTATSNQTATASVQKSFTLGTFSDPGADEPWQVTVDWGDGGATTSFSQDATGTLPDKSHIFASLGGYTVKVTVDDGDDSGASTFQVEVDAQVIEIETGSVAGIVFEDLNNNGTSDGSEGVQGASITLDQVSAAAFTNPATTDVDGGYAFSDVPAGTYILTVIANGYPSPLPVTITVQKDSTETVTPIAVAKMDASVDPAVYLPAVQSAPAIQAAKTSVSRGSVPMNGLDSEQYLPSIGR